MELRQDGLNNLMREITPHFSLTELVRVAAIELCSASEMHYPPKLYIRNRVGDHEEPARSRNPIQRGYAIQLLQKAGLICKGQLDGETGPDGERAILYGVTDKGYEILRSLGRNLI